MTLPRIDFQRLLRRAPGGGAGATVSAALPDHRVIFYANARAAIRAVCDRFEPGGRILVPAYHCGSEVDALVTAGLQVDLYAQSPGLVADPDDLAAALRPDTRAIYVIHYFGLTQPRIAEIAALVRARGVALIEDCALALGARGSDGAAGSWGDAAVFSFAKFFPLIEGGALAMPASGPAAPRAYPYPHRAYPRSQLLRRGGRALVSGLVPPGLRRALGQLKQSGEPDVDTALSEPKDIPAEYYFDAAYRDAVMNGLSRRLLASWDLETVAARRRGNLQALLSLLVDEPGVRLFPIDLTAAWCPLTLPVLVDQRLSVARALQAAGIAASPWWAGFHAELDWYGQEGATYLKNHGLALPVHQQLTESDMSRIAQVLAGQLSAG